MAIDCDYDPTIKLGPCCSGVVLHFIVHYGDYIFYTERKGGEGVGSSMNAFPTVEANSRYPACVPPQRRIIEDYWRLNVIDTY